MISVVVPVYNKSKYLNETLKSLDKQTCNDFEVVFVDDKSTDDSLAMLKSFKESTKSSVKIIEKETNTGVSDTRNIGVNEADGEYILFLDADDYLDKNFIKIAYDKLRKNSGIDIIRSQIILDKDGRKIKAKGPKVGNNKIIVPRKNRDYFINESAACWGRIYHSSIVNSIDFIDSGFEDYEFSIEAMLRSDELLSATNLKYYYRILSDGRYKLACKNIKENCTTYLDIYDRIHDNYYLSEFSKESLRIKKLRTCMDYLQKVLESDMSPEDKNKFGLLYLSYLKSHDALDKDLMDEYKDISEQFFFASIKKTEDFEDTKRKIKLIASKY